MVQKTSHRPSCNDWTNAPGLLAPFPRGEAGLHCALVPDTKEDSDFIAVVYPKGDAPPEITIEQISGSVHTVKADGVAVAVVGSATGPAPQVDDVLLVERSL